MRALNTKLADAIRDAGGTDDDVSNIVAYFGDRAARVAAEVTRLESLQKSIGEQLEKAKREAEAEASRTFLVAVENSPATGDAKV